MATAITTHQLEVRFGDVVALSGVDLEVPVASSLAVIGPNGSGKSTLLGALAGTLTPHSGSLEVAGSRASLVLQATEVDRSLPITVRESVALARYPHLGLLRRFGARDREIVDAALERLQVLDLADRQLHDLSGGQRQRVMVAQGLAQAAPALLLDEPVNGLDVVSRSIILDVIDEEVEAGGTVVVTTHSFDDAKRCDQVLLLDSTPIAVGPPSTVLTTENLKQAFAGHVIAIGDELMLDDPHHH